MTCKVKISFQDVQAQRNVRAIQQVINEKCAIKCKKIWSVIKIAVPLQPICAYGLEQDAIGNV